MDQQLITIAINGDSGEGVQLLGQLLSRDMARGGIYIKTEPNFPAEIRAPQGTQAGISGFKITASDDDHFVIDKAVDVLVALNPAGLVKGLDNLKPEGLLIINSDQFTDRDFKKAKVERSVFEDLKRQRYRIVEVPVTSLTLKAVDALKLSQSMAKQCKNMFVLGALLYLLERDYADTRDWLAQKLQAKQALLEANLTALKAGYLYFDAQEYQPKTYATHAGEFAPGTYRQINGNQALALGAISLVTQLQKPMLLAGYPITPASTILHEMQAYQSRGIQVVQAEDEIAACGMALGASYGGSLGLTCTSGPGLDLKMEMIGLAVMTELPLVVIDVQRAGPSTGLPTKTEQSDLLHAIHGRHGESPCVVIAAHSATDCFTRLRQAYEIALTFSTPVILLSDSTIANSIEVWQVPEELPKISLPARHAATAPFERDDKTGGRVLFDLGKQEVIQTLGGLEKDPKTGHVSYDPISHKKMSTIRQEKLLNVNRQFKGYEFIGTDHPEILLVTWGSTYTVAEAVFHEAVTDGASIALLRIDILHPIDEQIKTYLKSAERVLVLELNEGQLCSILRAQFLVDAEAICQLTGESFSKAELKQLIFAEIDQGVSHG